MHIFVSSITNWLFGVIPRPLNYNPHPSPSLLKFNHALTKYYENKNGAIYLSSF